MSILTVQHLEKHFENTKVLNDISFSLEEGQALSIIGSSGSGKTTLLRCVAGLERPESGSVTGVPERLGYVFQEDRLLEHLSAEGNLRFVLGRVYDPAAARALLDRLGLPDTGAQPVREFSGGMKRRLALARALLAPS